MQPNNQNQIAAIQPEIVRTKKPAPQNLITCSRLSYAEKMAIFNQRIIKVLRFLIDENYSNLENISKLLGVPKQTSSRICKHLCENNYLNRVEVDIGLAKSIAVFHPTNTGIMFALHDNEDIPELREVNRVNSATIYHDLKLQQIRLNLEAQGYTNFQRSWQLNRILKKRNEKVPTIPDYTCIDPEGNKIAIEYERTIKSKKRYQEIIGQYMEIRERGVIKQVIFYTDRGFATKLQHLFEGIDFIYQKGRTKKYQSMNELFFRFKDLFI